MAATQAESQRNEANVDQNPSEQLSESRNALLQNGTDKSVGRVPPDGVVNTKSKSPMSADPGQPRDGGEAPGHDRSGDQYGSYRYPEGADPYYAQRPGFPGKPRQPPQQRFFPGQTVSQAPGPTPTLNSLLQSSGAPTHRYANSYDQPPGGYGPAPGWPPPRPMPSYNPQGSPYRNSTPPRGYGAPPYGQGAPGGPQQPPGAYGPPGSYPPRYPPPPGPPGTPNSRPPFSPHQGYERGGSPQPPTHPPGAPSPGSAPGGISPTQDSQHPPHLPPGAQPPHQGYPPPPRPAQPSTPNAHDQDSDLTGQNSNDSGGSGGAGRATTPHLRPTPSPTGSSGSRSMSPAVGTQNVPMPPRPSSSLSDGSGPTVRAGAGAPGSAGPPPSGAPPPGAMLPQPYPHHGPYKPAPYPPQQYAYPPRNHHPYPYGGYRPTPPPHPSQHPSQHYPPLKQQQQPGRHMGPPGEAMPPPTAPGEAHDNGPAAPATALVTTGPDGAPLDEGSQQSTLSNASAASGEEPCGTPKSSRKEYGAGSAAPSPSPGGASHSSAHDDYDGAPSPWPRPPSSPVFNSHIPPESFRSKKSDSLGKLYEMDDAPERRGWVERLLAFMEERRTPIAACPTISKQPLDLYRLYLLVRDRGGFVEVTKNKTWKDIAGLLGIGASSSAAYTLRKHYTKNLLAYECHFDRGGIDPQPIINQVEASTKKKSGKSNSTSNAGSSNSQEQFPAGGAGQGGAPMDGYPAHYAPYPPQPNQPQGGGPGGDNLAASNPFDEPPGPRRPPGYQQGYGYEYGPSYPANRPVYPPYGPEGDRGYASGGEYRYGGYGGYRAGAPPAPGGAQPPAAAPAPPASPAQPYPDYYRPPHPHHPHPHPQHPPPPHPPHSPQQPHEMSGGAACGVGIMGSQLARQLVAPLPSPVRPYGGAGGGGANAAVAGAPRRHPDFAKVEGGFPPNAGAAGGAGTRFAGGSWGGFPRPAPSPAWRPPAPLPHQPLHHQPPWPPQPHPHQPYHPPAPGGAAWAPRPAPELPPAAPSPGTTSGVGQIKRELTFPPDCVEATLPAAEKRRRLTKADVAPVDAWRIMMALKSGLLAETCWALDILNILLFDDNCIGYFGLQHMPGLLDLLLEHFHKSLNDVFDAPAAESEPWYARPPSPEPAARARRRAEPPDPAERVRLVACENYTLESRRRLPVTLAARADDELFAPDEPEPDAAVDDVTEPWQLSGDSAAHVIPCPRADLLHLAFARVLPGERAPTPPAAPATPPRAPPEPTPPRAAPATPATPQGDNLEAEPMELEPERRPALQVRDPAGVLKRRRLEDYEDECYTRDEPSLNLVNESRDALAKRCVALSNILRGLTFVPGNEAEFSRSGAFLALAGKLLLLHHEHAPRTARARAYERAARDEGDADACCSSLRGEGEWWWDTLAQLREDALVACANIAGSVELGGQPEAVARPLLDGLLHWSVCPAAVAGDAPPAAAAGSPLSPRRLALEALCKLCVTDANVDLVLATPPRGRIAALCAGLARDLCRPERPVVREFAVNLLHYLGGAGGAAAREVALHAPAVAQLVAFIERAEQTALGVANQHGVTALRENPDAMGTSLDMLRRAAATLLRLAEHAENRPLIRRHERRLLSLVMSQILDQKVAHELADVLFHCSQ